MESNNTSLRKENTIGTLLRKSREFNTKFENFSISIRFPRYFKALEILFIAYVLYSSAPVLQNFSTDSPIIGNELSYLINGAVISRDIYQATGSLPVWNPFMARGEPMFESPHSFLLNPLMSLPILVFGPILGSKIGVLIHLLLMGAGGWALASVLRLDMPGRILLALLIGAGGGFPSAINRGFYQIALSQAYVPWIYAALIGVLYSRSRWPVALLAVATTLMIFAGSFWYVLPTAICCGLLVVFALLRNDDPIIDQMRIDRAALNRVIFAAVLIIGLSAARLIPQVAHARYVYHPDESFNEGMIDIQRIMTSYFSPVSFDDIEGSVHYITSAGFAAALFIASVLIPVAKPAEKRRWRIIFPALLSIFLFTVWAQGKTPIVGWLYEQIPLLREWRFLRRVLAAATPWIAVLLAIGLDDTIAGWLDWRRVPVIVRFSGVVVLVCFAIYSAGDVLGNWNRITGLRDNYSPNRAGIELLRHYYPERFMSIETREFWDYFGFFENRVRGAFGNPDYRALPLEPTLATPDMMEFDPEYGLAVGEMRNRYFTDQGYFAIAHLKDVDVYYNGEAPSHVFLTTVEFLREHDPTKPIKGSETTPVTSWIHNIESIEIAVHDYPPDSVLVSTDTAYPGWQVEINGQRAPLESVGGLIGVRLPADKRPVKVVFFYQPTLFYIGAIITVLASCATVFYMLRMDRLNRTIKFVKLWTYRLPSSKIQQAPQLVIR